jgi:hypothetical protein
MYRTIDARIWTDPVIRKLEINPHYLFMYFITNPHSHMSGIYYLPVCLVEKESKLSSKQCGYSIDTLSSVELIKYDPQNEVIWVKNMFKYQSCGPKSIRAAEVQLQTVINSPLVKEFCKKYSRVMIPNGYRIDTLSSVVVQEQEQEQNKKISSASQTCEIGKSCNGKMQDCSEAFEKFWKEYPRHDPPRKEARKRWCSKFQAGIDLELLLNWIVIAKERWTEKKFIPQPTTWINQERWKGDPPPEGKQNKHRKPEDRLATDEDKKNYNPNAQGDD